MCPRIRRMILAAVLGLVGGAGVASAQAPQPLPSAAGGPPPVTAPIAPQTVAPGAMAAAPVYGTAGYGGGCATGGCGATAGGCDTCAGGPRTKFGARLWNSPYTIGEGCPNPAGCGTWASERNFLWGGCNSFFTPGNKCGGLFSGGGLFGRGACAQYPHGAGGAGNVSTCCYGTYLSR